MEDSSSPTACYSLRIELKLKRRPYKYTHMGMYVAILDCTTARHNMMRIITPMGERTVESSTSDMNLTQVTYYSCCFVDIDRSNLTRPSRSSLRV